MFKGQWAEEVVKEKFLREKFELISQRQKLSHGEVDLIFQKNNTQFLIEVKFLNNPWMSFERLGRRQKQKIILNIAYQQSVTRLQVVGLLCLVDKYKNISIMNILD